MSKIKKTITVSYADGETVEVVRVKGAAWDDLTVLLKSIFTQFFTKKGYLGELFHHDNTELWGSLKQLCAILPIAGAEGGFLDFDRLDRDDWELLCTLFFTSTDSLDEETGCVLPEEEGGTYTPGKIAKFHGVDFFERIMVPALEANREIFNQKQKELQARTQALATEAMEPTATEPTATETEPIPLTRTKRQRTA